MSLRVADMCHVALSRGGAAGVCVCLPMHVRFCSSHDVFPVRPVRLFDDTDFDSVWTRAVLTRVCKLALDHAVAQDVGVQVHTVRPRLNAATFGAPVIAGHVLNLISCIPPIIPLATNPHDGACRPWISCALVIHCLAPCYSANRAPAPLGQQREHRISDKRIPFSNYAHKQPILNDPIVGFGVQRFLYFQSAAEVTPEATVREVLGQ
jgi:hypothetical protein